MTPFRLIYGKSCHFHVELEHRAYWVIKTLNLDYQASGEKRKLQLSELEDIWLAKLYKERTKRWHDDNILNREFKEGCLVLLFNSRLRLFLGKLRSWWSGSFMVKRVTPHRAVEVWSEPRGSFTVIGQRLKHYTTRGCSGSRHEPGF